VSGSHGNKNKNTPGQIALRFVKTVPFTLGHINVPHKTHKNTIFKSRAICEFKFLLFILINFILKS